MADSDTIGELIARKRAAGYDPEFEATLARKWLCAACGHTMTIMDHVWIESPNGVEPCCPKCDSTDIDVVDTGSPTLTGIKGGRADP